MNENFSKLGFVFVALALVSILGAGCGRTVETSGTESVYAMAAQGRAAEIHSAIREGFDVNTPDSNGRTLLHYAIEGNQAPMVEMLIVTYQANPNIADNSGTNAVELALQINNPDIIEVLYNEGYVSY